jgi:GTP-binding protein
MDITSAQFVKGIIGTDPILKEEKPTIAFVGRSNVGKSSVINSLTGRRDLVRTSAHPGRTQQINYFLINESLYFADLPGYGYAKLSLKQREKLRKLLLWYLTADEVKLDKLVLVIDIQAGLKDIDYELLATMQERGLPVIVVANKVDRLNQSERDRRLNAIREDVGECRVVAYSAVRNSDNKALLGEILA